MAKMGDTPIEYEHVTRDEINDVQLQGQANDLDVRLAAECRRLMGLYRMWRNRAEAAEAAVERGIEVLGGV